MSQPSRTALTWWLAAAVAVALAMASAVVILLLSAIWFLVLPVLAVLALVVAGICFAVSRSRPAALAFGIAVLGSLPLAVLLVFVFLVLASVSHPS